MAQLDEIERQVSGPCELLKLENCGHAPFRDQAEVVLSRMRRSFVNSACEKRRHRHRPDLARARHEPFLPAPARAAVPAHQGRPRRVVRGARRPGGAVLHPVGAVPDARRLRRRPLRRARRAVRRHRAVHVLGALRRGVRARATPMLVARRGARRPRQQRVPPCRLRDPQRARQHGSAWATPSARHGVVGYLGYAVAPVFSVAIGAAFGWHAPLLAGAALGVVASWCAAAQLEAPARSRAAAAQGRLRSAARRACC